MSCRVAGENTKAFVDCRKAVCTHGNSADRCRRPGGCRLGGQRHPRSLPPFLPLCCVAQPQSGEPASYGFAALVSHNENLNSPKQGSPLWFRIMKT